MSEEKIEKKYPSTVTGVIISRENGEIFLMRNKKWKGVWTIPGGHVEFGEKMAETVAREVKEETDMDISDIEFIGADEAIFPKEFHEKKHFIFLDFSAKFAGGEAKKTDENDNFEWVLPEKAIKDYKLPSYTKKFIERYIESKKADDDYEDLYKRALADYQNLSRQTAKEKEDFSRFAAERFVTSILPVYDNLKTSIDHAGEEVKANGWLEGIRFIIKQFKDILSEMGVEEIKTVGERFDHHSMEAMDSEATDDKEKDGIVCKEIVSGYKMKGRAIRAARVIVYKFRMTNDE